MRYILPLALTLGSAVAGAGCGFQDSSGQDAGGRAAALVEVAVTFTRQARGVELAAQGHFARFRADEQDRAATLLGLPRAGTIPLDGCVLVDVGEELDRAFRGGRAASADIQLLDAGRLLVKGPLDATQLARRRYPELTPEVSGVLYSAADAARLSLEPGAMYQAVGEGGAEVGPFVAQATAPRAFPVLIAPELRRGSDLMLRWAEAGEPSEPVLVTVAWSSRAGAREVRCRAVDDGVLVVPHALVASLSEVEAPAEVTVTRRRRAGFAAAGVGVGDLVIGLRDVAPLAEAP